MFTSKDKLLGSVELLSLIVCGLFQLLIWKCGLSKKNLFIDLQQYYKIFTIAWVF